MDNQRVQQQALFGTVQGSSEIWDWEDRVSQRQTAWEVLSLKTYEDRGSPRMSLRRRCSTEYSGVGVRPQGRALNQDQSQRPYMMLSCQFRRYWKCFKVHVTQPSLY